MEAEVVVLAAVFAGDANPSPSLPAFVCLAVLQRRRDGSKTRREEKTKLVSVSCYSSEMSTFIKILRF